jgi:hypothetical protein
MGQNIIGIVKLIRDEITVRVSRIMLYTVSIAPSVPRLAGVKCNSAPRAFSIFFLSSLADSAIAKQTR